jgi:hypothetical protein
MQQEPKKEAIEKLADIFVDQLLVDSLISEPTDKKEETKAQNEQLKEAS